MKCVALQEHYKLRLKDAGTTKVSQTTIMNGRSERGHKLGTGFAVHESVIHMIKEFKDVNPRISTLTLKDKNLHIVLINVHAPTEDKDEEKKEEFYDALEEVFDSTVGNIKIVLGDLNAKIGKEKIYHNVARAHSLHEHSNDNGSRIANFALGKGLIIKSTMFPRKDIYKYTWISPDGRQKNQIDRVLINNRFRNSITNVRTLRGADADSDHLLVGIWIRVKFKKQYRRKLNTIDRYDIEKLEEVNIQKDYIRRICETFKGQQITNTNDVNDVWIKIRNAVQQTAKITLGTKKNRKKPWFHKICEDANINIKECTYPTLEEIKGQVHRLKNHKSPGEDCVQAELLKKGGENVIQWIWQVIRIVWTTEKLPDDWKVAVVCPIHKKGDKQDCNNYRGISLLNVAYKIFSNCVLDRIKEKADQIIGHYQGGFRADRSTTDQMFIIIQLYQKSWEFDKEIHTLFVDFKKAYDSIHRESLLNIMKEFHFPQKLVNLVSISVMETSIRVKIGNSITEPATVNSGLRQGDSLSPILFNVALEKVIREMKIGPNKGIRLQNTSIGVLAYADDIVLMEESQDSLKSLFSKLHKAASKVGQCVNEGKTEYMFLSRRELPFCQFIKIDHFEFKRVEQFKYLGSFLTEKNNVTNEIAARIQAGNRCYYGLTKILSSRTISRRMKERLYTSLIRPVVLYGSETWPIREMDEHKFMVFERKVLRKIYGPVKDEITGEWRRRKNIELEILYGNADIVEVMRSRRLRWAGHAWRSQNPLLHAVMEQNPIGKRPLGRPRMRWEDVVKKDVERLGGCSNWRMLALDREVWKLGCETGWS
ncbi:hypothetical protein QTP88_001859 [Uroleucon formosanum]